jgi:putative salt-induced outer membrane protein
MHKTLLAVACAAVIAPGLAIAQDAPEQDAAQVWSGDAELAYLMKRGNTRSQTLTAKGNAERDGVDWRHIAKLEASNAKQRNNDTREDERTAERYFGSYKLDRKLDEANYIFNVLTAEKDRFTGYDYEASYALGYGRRLLDSERQRLDIEAGPGYRWRQYEEGQQPAGESRKEEDAILRLGLRYRLALSETAEFNEDLTTEIGEDSTVTRATTSLSTRITGAFSLRVSHVLRHTTDPAPDAKKTDQEITVGVVYKF